MSSKNHTDPAFQQASSLTVGTTNENSHATTYQIVQPADSAELVTEFIIQAMAFAFTMAVAYFAAYMSNRHQKKLVLLEKGAHLARALHNLEACTYAVRNSFFAETQGHSGAVSDAIDKLQLAIVEVEIARDFYFPRLKEDIAGLVKDAKSATRAVRDMLLQHDTIMPLRKFIEAIGTPVQEGSQEDARLTKANEALQGPQNALALAWSEHYESLGAVSKAIPRVRGLILQHVN